MSWAPQHTYKVVLYTVWSVLFISDALNNEKVPWSLSVLQFCKCNKCLIFLSYMLTHRLYTVTRWPYKLENHHITFQSGFGNIWVSMAQLGLFLCWKATVNKKKDEFTPNTTIWSCPLVTRNMNSSLLGNKNSFSAEKRLVRFKKAPLVSYNS